MANEIANPSNERPLFLHISIRRLIVLSILSFSLYEAYWIYKNWRYIKERDNLKISPFWRGIFGVFFCRSLLRRIYADDQARAYQSPSFSPDNLAMGWIAWIILGNLVARMPGELSPASQVISAFTPSFLCLAPVQNYVNDVAKKRNPSEPYHRWSSGHIVCLVIGLIFWAFILGELLG